MARRAIAVRSGNRSDHRRPGERARARFTMYVCRAQVQGSVTPGKWVKGNCNVAYNGSEVVMSQYQVAYGDAVWQPYSGSPYGLIRTGTDSDGAPLYSCRAHYNPGFPQGDQGNQPGKLLNGACRIPYGEGNSSLIRRLRHCTRTAFILTRLRIHRIHRIQQHSQRIRRQIQAR